MAHRVLVIDGQMFQTGAWHRGMGQYMLHMLEEISSFDTKPKEMAVIFNTNLPIDDSRLKELSRICPKLTQIQWNLPLPRPGKVKPRDEQQYKTELEKCIRESVTDHLDSVDYLITSPFTFNFYALFPEFCTKLLMFYDITPLLYWSDLGGYFPPELYLQRFKQIFEADAIFAISETTKADLLKVLGLPEDRVINIDGGYSPFNGKAKKPGFKVPKQYILLPTADLPHKNNQVAVRGFHEFCKNTGWNGKLLITSTFSEETKLSLTAESDRLQFTGNVPAEELNWLYQNASGVIFPSKYEGLGIPLLDAVAGNLPAFASRIPVFLEMSKTGYYYFDPLQSNELAKKLEESLFGDSFKVKQKQYSGILKKYTWKETARKFLEGLPSVTKTPAISQNKQQHIAIVGMHPGVNTNAIGQVAEKLYVQLYKNYKLDFYLDTNAAHPKDLERPTFLDQQDCGVFDISRLTLSAYKKYDQVIYLLDDNAWHRVAQKALVLPGYALYESLDKSLPWQAVLANQYASKELKSTDYSGMLKAVNWIKNAKPNASLNSKVAVLKSSRTPRSIIKQLMEQTT